MMISQNSFKTKNTLTVNGSKYIYFDIHTLMKTTFPEIAHLPNSLKVILENLLRHEDGKTVTKDHIRNVAKWSLSKTTGGEIAYRPARVLMQDFTGVPAVVDLASMRDAIKKIGGSPSQINPLSDVDLVIDHSVMVDKFGNSNALAENIALEYKRNKERYTFMRWGQKAFQNFGVVPPGTGICHQVNIEYLAKTVWTRDVDGETYAFPDTVVGTDSHTTMVNALAVLGWGVGGIEAEAAMLGQSISMLVPEVVGFRLEGTLQNGVTATDLVLTITQMLRSKGVVGKFVEFFGPGLSELPLSDRATISNMAPEYGATCGFFPIDQETINYLKLTGREDAHINLVEAYAKAQGMWQDHTTPAPLFTDTLHLDISAVTSCVAGPKRPQDRVSVSDIRQNFEDFVHQERKNTAHHENQHDDVLKNGDIVIAAITSCTNTSNPNVMLGAGLVAKKALEKGLSVKPWVKTSLAPGSQVVADYLEKADLQSALDALGFNIVGYGCTTCIGNSGPLNPILADAIETNDLIVTSVLSGNRNFEGRINPLVRANYLASPMLVVAYAIAGTVNIDITQDPLDYNSQGEPVYLKDIWPTNEEIKSVVAKTLTPEMFRSRYKTVFDGDATWQSLPSTDNEIYDWDDSSTYIKNPPYFDSLKIEEDAIKDIENARILMVLGDSVTTDHISPAGNIPIDGPAGKYLQDHGVSPADFNSFGARRGNHEIMMRGTFANIRIRNEMIPGVTGGYTKHLPSNKKMPIYDAAIAYQKERVPLIVIGGKEYGTGSSRDWAAKGTKLLGVESVIVESFERIHRSNLVGMGVLPLVFRNGQTRNSLQITGDEILTLKGLENISPGCAFTLEILRADGTKDTTEVICRIDTADELKYFKNGGILPYVLKKLSKTL